MIINGHLEVSLVINENLDVELVEVDKELFVGIVPKPTPKPRLKPKTKNKRTMAITIPTASWVLYFLSYFISVLFCLKINKMYKKN